MGFAKRALDRCLIRAFFVANVAREVYLRDAAKEPVDGQRLDLLVRGLTGTPEIRETIAACCQPNPGDRPNMREVLRLLAGATWAELQAERKQRRATVLCAAGVFALILLAVAE
jgi:hypothetical protein